MKSRPRSGFFRAARTAILCALLAGSSGCVGARMKISSAPLGMRHRICSPRPEDGPDAAALVKRWPSGRLDRKPSGPPGVTAFRYRHQKVDPIIREWQAKLEPSERKRMLVTYHERITLPRFPDLDPASKRNSPENAARLRRAQDLVLEIERQRDRAYAGSLARLRKMPGLLLLEKLWLAPVVAVELPLGSIATVLADSDVVCLEPVVGRDSPPSCPNPLPPPMSGSPSDDLIEGLRKIRSESFRTLGLPAGRLSLLDTGVWKDHDLLRDAPISRMADCVHGGVNCLDDGGLGDVAGFDAGDQCRDNIGHGTPAAAILVGTSALGPRFRGGLDHTLESYQVYERSTLCRCQLCLDRLAAHRAFQESRLGLVPVIVANLTSKPGEMASLCASANGAFDTGAVVVAANGSEGEWVTAPAAATRAIGVGSRHLLAITDVDPTQNVGPAEFDRFKPDIQGPTGSESARFIPDCPESRGFVYSFEGTSGATPYAGVAAALLRDYMLNASPELDPGNVYAGLILSGRRYAPNLGNVDGAGLIALPTDCCLEFGTEELYVDHSTFDIPIDLTGGTADTLEAAIWWPEEHLEYQANDEPLQHNDFNLFLIDPSGVARASSTNVWSVFERVTAHVSPSARGLWKMRVEVASFWGEGRDGDLPHNPSRRHKVYWAAAAREP